MQNPRDPFLLLTGGARPPSLFGRIVATIAAIGIFALAFTVSVFVLAGALAVGAIAWGWFMWKTRALRRDLRAQMDTMQRNAGRDVTIIEGEVIRERTEDTDTPR